MFARPFHFLLLAISLVSCRDIKAPEADRTAQPKPDLLATIKVRDGAGQMFSFFDHRAELRTVERIDQVLASARAEVLVTDPQHPLPGDAVYLADLRKPVDGANYRIWVDRRGAWLDREMPKLSKLPRPLLAAAGGTDQKSPPKAIKKKRPRRPRQPPQLTSNTPAATPPAQSQPRVLLFSTSWCPSCKAARAYFTAKGVRFLELDVENNQQAAQAYQQIAAAHGLKAGAVPMIVIDGRPLQGFSPAQVGSMLAAAGLMR